ncbi:hypothetical protein BKA81DRAFT_381270 [Phyllosticta paracitricarpa]
MCWIGRSTTYVPPPSAAALPPARISNFSTASARARVLPPPRRSYEEVVEYYEAPPPPRRVRSVSRRRYAPLPPAVSPVYRSSGHVGRIPSQVGEHVEYREELLPSSYAGSTSYATSSAGSYGPGSSYHTSDGGLVRRVEVRAPTTSSGSLVEERERIVIRTR